MHGCYDMLARCVAIRLSWRHIKREEKWQETIKGSDNIAKEENNNRSNVEVENDDPITKRIIRDQSIISGRDNHNERAQAPDDVLAFSRSVQNVDSSLE